MLASYQRDTGSYDFPLGGETSADVQEALEGRVKELEDKVVHLEHGMRTYFRKWYGSKDFGIYISEFDKSSFYVSSYQIKKSSFDFQIKLPVKPLTGKEIGVKQFFSIGPYSLLGKALGQNFGNKALVGVLIAIFGPWGPCFQAYTIISAITISMGLMAFLFTKNKYYFKNFIRLVGFQPVLFFIIALGNQMDIISPFMLENTALFPFRSLFMVFFAFFNICCCVSLIDIMGIPLPESFKKFTQKVKDFLQA